MAFVRPKKSPTVRRPDRSGLVDSKEAQRQLQAGANLVDGAPAVPVPILEQFFDDADLYTRPNDTLKTPSPYVTPESAFVRGPAEIRGVQSHVLGTVFSKQMLRKGAKGGAPRLKTDNFTIFYFPPWHPVALARRSRPSMVLCFSEGKEYNGRQVPKPSKLALQDTRSRNPFSYAVWRGKTKRLFKRLFWDAWKSTVEPADGLYVVLIDKYPEDSNVVKKSMGRFILQVNKVADYAWVDRHMEQFQLPKINRMLSQRHYRALRVWPKDEWAPASQGSS